MCLTDGPRMRSPHCLDQIATRLSDVDSKLDSADDGASRRQTLLFCSRGSLRGWRKKKEAPNQKTILDIACGNLQG